MTLPPDFLMGIETELLTAVAPRGREWSPVVAAFLAEMRRLAPSLGGQSGFFNGYGRVYLDGSRHLELASAECDSPYTLASVVARQQALAARAMAAIRDRYGMELILANNNHAGRLSDGAPTWGAHENYLVSRPPDELADRMLPFLVSRVYGGAGGLWHPTGVFLAGVRIVFLQTDVGGGTTERRALFSTCRQEHLLGPQPSAFRCHLILGDGHRSHFNLALHLGATALVLAAMQQGPRSVHPLPRLAGADQRRFWLAAAHQFNHLARPGEPLRVAPLALDLQRFYLHRAQCFAEALPPHSWAHRLLADWEQTLDRMAAGDDDWLAARLDAWIKHRLFSHWLREHGRSWHDLIRLPHLFNPLVLLDHSYHEFANPDNVFDQLDRAGLLAHRVGPAVAPGSEPEPFIPETATRARARARFLLAHDGDPHLEMSWASVFDRCSNRCRRLDDPFAADYEPWSAGGGT
jgi:proteasome accessory factor A